MDSSSSALVGGYRARVCQGRSTPLLSFGPSSILGAVVGIAVTFLIECSSIIATMGLQHGLEVVGEVHCVGVGWHDESVAVASEMVNWPCSFTLMTMKMIVVAPPNLFDCECLLTQWDYYFVEILVDIGSTSIMQAMPP